MKKIKITIEGMHCASCASNAEKSLKKISGVKSASVSVITKKGFVETEDSVSDEELKKAVARAGYKVISIE
jgi:copper chaperone CopZ